MAIASSIHPAGPAPPRRAAPLVFDEVPLQRGDLPAREQGETVWEADDTRASQGHGTHPLCFLFESTSWTTLIVSSARGDKVQHGTAWKTIRTRYAGSAAGTPRARPTPTHTPVVVAWHPPAKKTTNENNCAKNKATRVCGRTRTAHHDTSRVVRASARPRRSPQAEPQALPQARRLVSWPEQRRQAANEIRMKGPANGGGNKKEEEATQCLTMRGAFGQTPCPKG